MTRSERFKAARTELNQHGEETVRQVAESVGVASSMVSELENPTFNRNITYQNAAALAQHYGVDLVWLMEGTAPQSHQAPAPASIAEYTGLSVAAIEQLHRIAMSNLSNLASAVIDSNHFINLLLAIAEAVHATEKAKEVCPTGKAIDKSKLANRLARETDGYLSPIETDLLPATYQYLAEYHLNNLINDLSNVFKKSISIEQLEATAAKVTADYMKHLYE